MITSIPLQLFLATLPDEAREAGFRVGDKGTHTSRTMMFSELEATLAVVSADARREDYARAIIEDNCLNKSTAATRRLSNQRLAELYGLDPGIALFRILRRLWAIDAEGRPLLALLCVLARDPLLACTASAIVSLPESSDLQRNDVRSALRATVGDRLNDSILDKVARNVASSWTQSGHLEGRTFKRRRRVIPTATSVAFALYLGYLVGFRGEDLLKSGWLAVLDCTPDRAQNLAAEAKRIGLIDLRAAGSVFELRVDRLDPFWTGR